MYVSCSERYKYCTFTSVDENPFTLEITCGSCNYSKLENPTVSEESGFRFCGVRYEWKLSVVYLYIYNVRMPQVHVHVRVRVHACTYILPGMYM